LGEDSKGRVKKEANDPIPYNEVMLRPVGNTACILGGHYYFRFSFDTGTALIYGFGEKGFNLTVSS
jgi:hypothetical protein